jgi:hypothetical protein
MGYFDHFICSPECDPSVGSLLREEPCTEDNPLVSESISRLDLANVKLQSQGFQTAYVRDFILEKNAFHNKFPVSTQQHQKASPITSAETTPNRLLRSVTVFLPISRS